MNICSSIKRSCGDLDVWRNKNMNQKSLMSKVLRRVRVQLKQKRIVEVIVSIVYQYGLIVCSSVCLWLVYTIMWMLVWFISMWLCSLMSKVLRCVRFRLKQKWIVEVIVSIVHQYSYLSISMFVITIYYYVNVSMVYQYVIVQFIRML